MCCSSDKHAPYPRTQGVSCRRWFRSRIVIIFPHLYEASMASKCYACSTVRASRSTCISAPFRWGRVRLGSSTGGIRWHDRQPAGLKSLTPSGAMRRVRPNQNKREACEPSCICQERAAVPASKSTSVDKSPDAVRIVY